MKSGASRLKDWATRNIVWIVLALWIVVFIANMLHITNVVN